MSYPTQLTQNQPDPGRPESSLKIIPLGGLGEIGLNMMVIQYEDTIILIDAGLMFPEEHMLGVDVVIPDITYLKENQGKIKAVILTHGHEDHIGAIPFLIKHIQAPIYGTRLTLEILKIKLQEHRLEDVVPLRLIAPRGIIRIDPFSIECLHVNHSIMDGVGLAISSPVGTIIHSGDFKIDQTPIDGRLTDLGRFATYGESGVLALLSDSTNVEREGYSPSENILAATFKDIFRECKGRIVVAVFASNIQRIQQVVSVAREFNRKIAFNGKSMHVNMRIAKELGYLKIPSGMEINIGEIRNYPDERIIIVTTGSQGEPMSALTRMAVDDHKYVKIKRGDTVILSSKFIPGNEKAISDIINSLYRRGAEVVYEKVSHIHTSGHAYQEELKLLLTLTHPKYFVPIHGEYRHLVKHAQLARSTGIPAGRVLIAHNGNVISFDHQGDAAISGTVPVGRVLVDGKGIGEVGEIVLRDRHFLSADGMVVFVTVVDTLTGAILNGPDVLSRGFIFEGMKQDLLEDSRCIVIEVFERFSEKGEFDWLEIENEIRREVRKFFYNVLKRRPMILPMIIPM
ncbi:MAG: ribonuclease J [Deltaproteobacteria bacterium]|nr:ribonuclease J [Deltaproteobacteria bacterium]